MSTQPAECGGKREEEERESGEKSSRRKREQQHDSLFSPLTSYVTAETELKTLITELQVKRCLNTGG